MSMCKDCQFYTPEYQGKYTEYENHCVQKHKQVNTWDAACEKFISASQEQMKQRQKVWDLWEQMEAI